MPGSCTKTSIQKDVETCNGHKRRNRPPNPSEKIIPGAQFHKEPRCMNQKRRKKSEEIHTPTKSENMATGGATWGAGASQFKNKKKSNPEVGHGRVDTPGNPSRGTGSRSLSTVRRTTGGYR